ncbi:hypothetical protein HMPREF1366_03076 [Enterococcus faecium ERV26]|nr:hypothetical protein HMPREF1381_02129 [Enterococcus faecium R501]EJX81985.1 hypothetical protein HMPREF1368_02771 [Enterococcus faecium ERV69]EJX87732.1 hypothetical protein HMPREF1366_03076 [Enterococcus faecium ERV26]TYR06326.1 hypothetical protein BEK95_00535 [Enterococcus faecium]TYR08495.1 hypothetical protein BEK96_03230 [Enterococcus faecium]
MACHDVGEVPKALRCVAMRPDVDVDSASSGGVAFRSCVSELSAKLLQGFDIPVGQDRSDQFAFLLVRSCDGNVLLEFPLAPLCVPGAPGAVAVAACGILVSACAEEVGGNLGCLLAGDAVHLDLDPDGLVFHLCDLPCCFLVHGESSVFVWCVFPFGVHIFALKEDNSKAIFDNILHKDDRKILCSLYLFTTIRCVLDLSAQVFSERHGKAAAVVPGDHDGADIIHAHHSALCADWRCLGIVHPQQLHSGA